MIFLRIQPHPTQKIHAQPVENLWKTTNLLWKTLQYLGITWG